MSAVVHFGPFSFDPATDRLERAGTPVPLQTQPARVLAVLVARAGEVVTRDELRRAVWGDTWVNFDQGLNYCVRQIRLALSDEARAPVYVQTLPQRGYRFVAAVEQRRAATPQPATLQPATKVARWVATVVLALTIGLVLGLETAQRVLVDVGATPEATALAGHLSPSHVVRGAWEHHLRPLAFGVRVTPAARVSAAR